MGLRLRRSAGEPSGSLDQPVEAWPYLEQGVLQPSRSHCVCMTCHWFRHHSGVNCIPLLTRQRGWAPEAG